MAQVILIRLDQTDYEGVCYIGIGEDAAKMFDMVQYHSPLPVELLHWFDAHNRAEFMLKTLDIKFEAKRLHDRWFQLDVEDIEFIKEITSESHFVRLPEIQDDILKATHPEKFEKRHRRLRSSNPGPRMGRKVDVDKLEKMRQALLEKAKKAMNVTSRRKAS